MIPKDSYSVKMYKQLLVFLRQFTSNLILNCLYYVFPEIILGGPNFHSIIYMYIYIYIGVIQ